MRSTEDLPLALKAFPFSLLFLFVDGQSWSVNLIMNYRYRRSRGSRTSWLSTRRSSGRYSASTWTPCSKSSPPIREFCVTDRVRRHFSIILLLAVFQLGLISLIPNTQRLLANRRYVPVLAIREVGLLLLRFIYNIAWTFRQPQEWEIPSAPTGYLRTPGRQIRRPDGEFYRAVHSQRIWEGEVGDQRVSQSTLWIPAIGYFKGKIWFTGMCLDPARVNQGIGYRDLLSLIQVAAATCEQGLLFLLNELRMKKLGAKCISSPMCASPLFRINKTVHELPPLLVDRICLVKQGICSFLDQSVRS